MVCEEIKPEIFDINREMPTDAAAPLTRAFDSVSGLVPTRPPFPSPYHTSNRPKTRSEGFQRNVLALFRLLDDI